MANKVRWGVLSTAGIGVKKVVPAMQKGDLVEVIAIASRDLGKARETARSLGIAQAYGSYEELLADPQVEAIYNPLPNQLHVPWSIKAAEAGKHVLCEKPLSMTVAEAKTLLEVQQRTGVLIGEAFMVRTHPQWLRTRDLVTSGRIGALRLVQGFFSYYNTDPKNIRNHSGVRRRCAYGYRVLPHPHRTPAVRRRTVTGVCPNGKRSSAESRPVDFRHARVPLRPGDVYLQHPAGSLPAGASAGNRGPHRSGNTFQRAH